MQEYSRDLTTQVSTAGSVIATPSSARRWMALTNEGPNIIDLTWIDPADGTSIRGRIRLQAGQGAVFNNVSGDMAWHGSLSAVAYTATTTLAGVEVYVQ